MRAIIDASGLPEAVSYYRMFPHEPARSAEDDMTIDRVVPIQHITLEILLDEMLAARAEREVLVVTHGEAPQGASRARPATAGGLIMHLTRKAAVSALKEPLDLLSHLGAALARRAQIRAQPADDQVNSWIDLAEDLALQLRGDFTLHEAEASFGRWFAHQATRLKMSANDVEHLIRKMNAVREARFERVEVRACNLGSEFLEALRNFLGASRVCAPSVGTFYVSVYPRIAGPATQARWERVYGGPARSPVYRRGAGPTAQHYDVYVPGRRNPLDGLIVPDAFEIRVWETSRHPHRYASQAVAGSWAYVQAWVDQNIMRLSRYRRGSFVLAGMWIFGRGAQPFATPLDREYREVLACSSRSAAGDFPASLTPGQALA